MSRKRYFDPDGRLAPELAELAPHGDGRMGANPHVNGGRVLKTLVLPDFIDFALEVPGPGRVVAEAPQKARGIPAGRAAAES